MKYITGDEYIIHYKQKLLDNSKVKIDQQNLLFITNFQCWNLNFEKP
jgi:hypothetical protein